MAISDAEQVSRSPPPGDRRFLGRGRRRHRGQRGRRRRTGGTGEGNAREPEIRMANDGMVEMFGELRGKRVPNAVRAVHGAAAQRDAGRRRPVVRGCGVGDTDHHQEVRVRTVPAMDRWGVETVRDVQMFLASHR